MEEKQPRLPAQVQCAAIHDNNETTSMQSRNCLHICDILDIAHPQVVTLRADNSVHLVTVESLKATATVFFTSCYGTRAS